MRAAPVRSEEVIVGPGDDAAVLAGGVVLTVDALVEGVHWDERVSPRDLGFKAVAVNASDLGAMGARPRWMVLALCLPYPVDTGWVRDFSEGLGEASEHFEVPLVGGDTTRSPGPRLVSITMGGIASRPVLRSGGRPGDTLWVTGTLGLAAAGYVLSDPPEEALAALRRPEPPVRFGAAAGEAGLLHAMMDLSDGLATDLPRLCRASGVGAKVDPASLPAHPCIAGEPGLLRLQVGGGDDYQLLLAAPATSTAPLRALALQHGIPLTAIGTLTASPAVRLMGAEWPPPHFDHFSEVAS